MVTVSRRRRRNSLRLQGYDYSQPGDYFVTFCAQDRLCLFGDIEKARMTLNPLGQMVEEAWYELPTHYGHVVLEDMVVMPNHVHAILQLTNADLPFRPPLSEVVRAWKAFSARTINKFRNTPTTRIWQRGFWDHIIQNDKQRWWIQTYIRENPLRWTLDQLHPNQPPYPDPPYRP
jgi:putative transposase